MNTRFLRICLLTRLPAAFWLGLRCSGRRRRAPAVREKVAGMFDGIGAEDVFASDVDGWYTVRKGAIIAYISGDGRYLLQGDMIDLEESKIFPRKAATMRASNDVCGASGRCHYVHAGNGSSYGLGVHRHRLHVLPPAAQPAG